MKCFRWITTKLLTWGSECDDPDPDPDDLLLLPPAMEADALPIDDVIL